MLSATRERPSGQIVLKSSGILNDASVRALLQAITLAPSDAPIVIDLSEAYITDAECLGSLALGLAGRGGLVLFRGPPGAQALRQPR